MLPAVRSLIDYLVVQLPPRIHAGAPAG
jgi:hypothetical protein